MPSPFAAAADDAKLAVNGHGANKDTHTLVKRFERNAGVAIAPKTSGTAEMVADLTLIING